MTVSLGGILLDDNLRLQEPLNQSSMAGSARPTFGGVCIQTMAMASGRTLQLEATREGDTLRGVFTRATLLQLVALRDAGLPVPLIHHVYSGQVWIPPDGIAVESALDHADPGDDEWYTGTITLITV